MVGERGSLCVVGERGGLCVVGEMGVLCVMGERGGLYVVREGRFVCDEKGRRVRRCSILGKRKLQSYHIAYLTGSLRSCRKRAVV